MADHQHTAYDYALPDPSSNSNTVPALNLVRATWVLHQVLMGGGLVEQWDVFKLDGPGGTEVEELPDVIEWRHIDGNEILRATLARDGNDLVTSITFSFAPDGATFVDHRIATPVRGASDGVKRLNWSDP